jgi:hypothetical protein
MSGAIPPLPNTPSWRGAQFKHRDNFTFYLYHEERYIVVTHPVPSPVGVTGCVDKKAGTVSILK